ncbi:MAG: hypothetical protein AVDCRST_MAG02-1499 [uncultured Rubrobacteraceae bacterium]|uniref:SnoaL-like domain-containing protein n=1 Tax=uncultured Rubrobacteraceae bacterium TaxID=349277 RepID=A0A6J4QZ55_9ACTN|nr:MAG: hypothetical protein AVDCRST_MAG02-1499 [uncultured Rubrobacteraceae bacterium]
MGEQDTVRERNLALVRRFCEARANKDQEAIMGCLTEDVVWRYPGRNPLSREYRGKEDVAGFFRGLREVTGGNFSSETERIMADETAAFVHELPRGTRKGKSLEWRTVLMFRLRDGKIAEVDVFQNVQHELDEWWNS